MTDFVRTYAMVEWDRPIQVRADGSMFEVVESVGNTIGAILDESRANVVDLLAYRRFATHAEWDARNYGYIAGAYYAVELLLGEDAAVQMLASAVDWHNVGSDDETAVAMLASEV